MVLSGLVDVEVNYKGLDHRNELLRINTMDVSNDTAYCRMVTMVPFSLFVGDQRIAFPRGVTLQHMAAVALALSHLNSRDGTVIPELTRLQQCKIKFTSEFVDTAFRESQAAESVLNIMDRTNLLPCAFIGEMRPAVTNMLATLTTLRGYPQVSPMSPDPTVSEPEQFRYLARLSPSLHGWKQPYPLLQFLYTEYDAKHLIIAYKHGESKDALIHCIVRNAEQFFPDMKIKVFAIPEEMEQNQVDLLMQSIQAASFRYVYAVFDENDYGQIFDAAVQRGIAGMESGYTWIWADMSVEGLAMGREFEPSSPVFQAMVGSLLFSRIGSAPGLGRYDAFIQEWNRLGQSKDDLEYLLSKIPRLLQESLKEPLLDQNVWATDSPYFPFSTLYYDAAIATGLAACENNTTKAGSYPTGPEHFAAMITQSFVGASGHILFDPVQRARAENTSSYRIWNFVPKRTLINRTATLKKVEVSAYDWGGWSKPVPTIFANGKTTIPPALPVVDQDRHYIGNNLRKVGFVMASVVVFISFACSKWTLVAGDQRIVKASQPIFLHMICIGTGLMGLSIAIRGLDDETIGDMDAVCASVPALQWLGWCFAFSAILSKTLRINKIFHNPRFKRIRVTCGDVIRPMFFLLGSNVVILVARGIIDPLRWERTMIKYDDYGRVTESVGVCTQRTIVFECALVIINAGVVAIASYQSYIARKISTEFSESEYIAKAVTMVLVVSFMAVPIYYVADDSTKSRFLAQASSVFVISLSLLLLIFVPKMFYRGDGVSAGIRRSSHLAHQPNQQSLELDFTKNNSFEDDKTIDLHRKSDSSDDGGMRVVDHPKINSQLADKLIVYRQENAILKQMIRELKKQHFVQRHDSNQIMFVSIPSVSMSSSSEWYRRKRSLSFPQPEQRLVESLGSRPVDAAFWRLRKMPSMPNLRTVSMTTEAPGDILASSAPCLAFGVAATSSFSLSSDEEEKEVGSSSSDDTSYHGLGQSDRGAVLIDI